MNRQTPGARLKAVRNTQKMKQTQLARLTGVRQSRISALENERRRVSAHEWAKFCEWLPLGPLELPAKLVLPAPRAFWRTETPERTSFGQCAVSVREFAARKSFGALAVRRRAEASRLHDPILIAKFLSDANNDSGHEIMLLTHLMAEGAAPCWFRPLKAGYRGCIVDRQTKENVSDLRLACLDLAGKSWNWLIFPQITVNSGRGFYRLDALVNVRRTGESYWLNLEVDGEGHDSEFDERRARHIGLPTLRLRRTDLARLDVLTLMEEKASQLFDMKIAT